MKFFPRTTSFFDDAFDDVFSAPFFRNTSDATMKTDITEKDDNYLLDIELPGCKKEDIKMELDDGYLNVMASRNTSSEKKMIKEILFDKSVSVEHSNVVSM